MADVIYLTQQGLDKLKDELKYLKEIKRVDIAKKLKEAIEFGDLSENSEYEEARNEQSQVEVRISEIEEQLKNVEIIKESKSGKTDKVIIGSLVTIVEVNENEELTYKIVGTTESDILASQPRISNDSPIGNSLLGKKIGDVVKIKAPAGTFEYKIIKIS